MKTLSEILSSPIVGIRSIKSEGSVKFLKLYGTLDDVNAKNFDKRVLKGEFQLLCEFVIGALLPIYEKGIIKIGPVSNENVV